MAKKIPDVLSLEEQKRLLDTFNLRYITPQRNKTLVKTLLNTGMRSAEVRSLKWRNVDLNVGKIKVVEGKGSKDRILWVNEYLKADLRDWKERQFQEWGDSEYVFSTRNATKIDSKALRTMIKIYCRKAGIEKNISTHSLRHTFATDLLRDTGNIRIVQKALGHSDISTTMLYTHIIDTELEESMKNFRNRGRSDG